MLLRDTSQQVVVGSVPRNRYATESRNWVKNDLSILRRNVGGSPVVRKFIFQFHYVDPFNHDDLPIKTPSHFSLLLVNKTINLVVKTAQSMVVTNVWITLYLWRKICTVERILFSERVFKSTPDFYFYLWENVYFNNLLSFDHMKQPRLSTPGQ